MRLEVEGEDVHELSESRDTELNTEELQHLPEDQEETLADYLSSDEDEVRENVPRSLMCAKWREVQLFEEKYHTDTILANNAVHFFNDNAMMHFRKILQ